MIVYTPKSLGMDFWSLTSKRTNTWRKIVSDKKPSSESLILPK